jgi:hypothetical protein
MTSMRSFIRANRTEIDDAINGALYRHDGRGGKGTIPNPPPKRNDSEREGWIQNDEGLYSWARREGVPI